MMAIRSIAQYDAWAKRRSRAIYAMHGRVNARALTKLVNEVRTDPAFPFRTGNLLHSVGVPGPIESSPTPLPGLPSDYDEANAALHIRVDPGRVRGEFHVGMEYAGYALPEGVVEGPLAEFPQMLRDAYERGHLELSAELGLA